MNVESCGPNDLPSPYLGRKLTFWEQISISCFWFGTNFLWGSMLPLIIPDAMLRLAPKDPIFASSWLISIGAVNGLLVPLIAGALSDRCTSARGRRKPYIASGVLIFSVGALLMMYAFMVESLAGFFFGYFILNVGMNISSAAYAGIIPDVVPPEQRGVASGYMGVMTMLGAASGAIVIGQLLQRGLHVPAYLLIIAVISALMAITYYRVKETPMVAAPPPLHWQTYLRSLWIDPRKYADFAWVWVTRALVMLGFYSIPHIVLYYLRDAIGVAEPKKVAGQIMAFVILGAAVSAVVAGAISDRVGRKRVVYLANAFMGLTALAFAFLGNLNAVIVVAMLFGLGYGAYLSVDWALGTDTLPSRTEAGKLMAVWHVAQELPHIMAAIIAGQVLSQFKAGVNAAGETVYSSNGYAAVFGLAATFVLAGAVLLRNVRGVR